MISPVPVHAEVLVVGGGPAGAATALRLARAGVDVLIVDRAAFPRPKACGECLSPGATELLAELGVLDRVLALEPARLRGWRIVAPAGGRMEAAFTEAADGHPLRGVALAVDRASFDALLLRAAVEAGARLLPRCRVTGVVTAGGRVTGVNVHSATHGPFTIDAGTVVGADGLRSVVARSLRLTARAPRLRKLSLTAHLPSLPGLDGYGELHLAAGACAGVAPIAAGPAPACNVTLVVTGPGESGPAAPRGPEARFLAALAQFPALERRCRAAVGAAFGADPGGIDVHASGPFDAPMRRVAGPGFALVGDAAGYFDPFTGQGICHALLGAARLSDALLRGRARGGRTDAALASYGRAEQRHRRHAHTLQRAIERVVRTPALADRLIPAVQRSPRVRAALLAATGDIIAPRALLSPALLFTFLADTLKDRK